MTAYFRSSMIALALFAGAAPAAAQSPNMQSPTAPPPVTDALSPAGTTRPLELTAEQRGAIFKAISEDKTKVTPPTADVQVAVGQQVPPSIELYILPDGALAVAPATRPFKYTVVQNQVVLVDPTNMRIVEVIRQ